MVLYEDLRIYTIWRTDMARSKTEESSGEYRKSAEEWEILGELAERLHHFPEAVEAYQSCLRIRFSPKAMRGVLRMYEGQGRVSEMLQCVIRLVAWQYRWYSEVCLVLFSLSCAVAEVLTLWFQVLSIATSHRSQTHRKRRCSEGPKYRTSNQPTTTRTGSHEWLCRTLRFF